MYVNIDCLILISLSSTHPQNIHILLQLHLSISGFSSYYQSHQILAKGCSYLPRGLRFSKFIKVELNCLPCLGDKK